MKIRLNEFLVNLLIVLASGIMLVFPIVLDTWRTVVTFLVMISAFVCLIHYRKRKAEKNFFFSIYIWCFCIIAFIGITKGNACFKYTAYEAFYGLRQYIWIFAAIPVYTLLIHSRNIDATLEKLINIVLFSLLLRFFTWWVGNFLGLDLFPNLLYEYGLAWGRGGLIRIDATAFIGVIIPLLLYLYEKYNSIKYLLELCFATLYVIVVAQTRMLIIAVAGSIISVVFFKRRKTQVRLVVQLIMLLGIAVIFRSGLFNTLLQRMNISIEDGSIGYRQYEYLYYSSLLTEGRWKLGIGIISSVNTSANRVIAGNLNTVMYLDDLGAFECFFQFGMLSLLLYGLLIFYLLKVFLKCDHTRNEFSIYLISQLLYILIASIGLNLFGIQRIFSVPIILAIVCTIENQNAYKIN